MATITVCDSCNERGVLAKGISTEANSILELNKRFRGVLTFHSANTGISSDLCDTCFKGLVKEFMSLVLRED